MSEKITNALAEMKQVYLEQVGHNNLEKQRLDEEVKQINEFKKTKLDPVGEEDDDINNDGKVNSTDSYLRNRRRVITSKIKESSESDQIETHMNDLVSDETEKSNEAALNVLKVLKTISSLKPQPQVKESTHYSWRDTVDESILWEIIDDTQQKQVKEKKVNNYSGKEPVITVNPEFNTESVIIDTVELNEDFIQESIDIVTDYLCEEGFSVEQIQYLIEDVGVEEFSEWVIEFGYETLCEQQAFQGELLTSKGQARKNPEVSKRAGASTPVSHTPSKSEPEKKSSATSSPGQLSLNLTPKAVRRTRVQGKVVPGSRTASKPSAAAPSPSKPSAAAPEPKKGFFASAIERDRAARQKAGDLIKQTVQTAQKAGQAASKFGSSVREPFETTKAGRNLQAALIKGLRTGSRAVRDAAAKEVAKRRVGIKEEFESWVEDLLDEGYDLSDWTWDELYEEYEELCEKAVSEQQQKIFGLALSVKRGETPRSKVSDEVLKIVDSMPEKEIRKYAKTSHEGIPKKVDESYLIEKVIDFVRENR